MGKDFLLGLLQEGDDLLARHCGEPFEKAGDALPGFQVVQQRLYRHPGPSEDRRTAENFRIMLNHRRLHATIVPSYHGANQEKAVWCTRCGTSEPRR